MVRCICDSCGREVNGRVPAKGGGVHPYRHLPPSELGRGFSHQLSPGRWGWFGTGLWCPGSFTPAQKELGS